MGPQPEADSVPGQGGAVLAPGVSLQDLREAGDGRDQRHQENRGQHGGGGAGIWVLVTAHFLFLCIFLKWMAAINYPSHGG